MGIDVRENLFAGMRFGFEKCRNGAYGSTYSLKMLSIEQMVYRYVSAIVNGSEYIPYIFISTVIEDSLFPWKRKHLLVLDCDSEDGMVAACHWLRTEENIKYELIESTPGKFWVVTDFIGTWKHVWRVFDQIPGVCEEFRNKYAKKYKRICVRAFPKLINGKPCAPIFPADIALKSFMAKQWMMGVRLYFDSGYFKKLCKAVLLVDKLDKNAMEQLAANPGFMV